MEYLPNNLKLFINGEFVDSISGKTFPVINPATEEIICKVSEGDKEDVCFLLNCFFNNLKQVDKAVQAAEEALEGEWKKIGRIGRQKLLLKLADLWDEKAEELAKLESFVNGSKFKLVYF